MGDCYRGCPCGSYERLELARQQATLERARGLVLRDSILRPDEAMVARIVASLTEV